MNPEWISGRLFQPGQGFAAPMQIPSYSGAKIKGKGFSTLPSFKGIDFKTGKTVDLANYLQSPIFGVQKEEDSMPTESALPKITPELQGYLDLAKAMGPLNIEQMKAAADISAQLSERQLAQLSPYLDWAGSRATARSLAASKEFLAAKQAAPTTIQEITASKQGQRAAASSAFAQEAMAAAEQQRAASQYPGRFAGQYVSFG